MAKRFLAVVSFLILIYPSAAWTASSQIRISVFNFGTVNMEASGLGATVTNTLIGLLAEDPLLSMLDRKELEAFLSMNDLQQNDQMDNVVNIGTRLGLNVVVVGSVDKKGSVITVQCKAIQIGQKKMMFNARVVADPDSHRGTAREGKERGRRGLRRAHRGHEKIGKPEYPPAVGGAFRRDGCGL